MCKELWIPTIVHAGLYITDGRRRQASFSTLFPQEVYKWDVAKLTPINDTFGGSILSSLDLKVGLETRTSVGFYFKWPPFWKINLLNFEKCN